MQTIEEAQGRKRNWAARQWAGVCALLTVAGGIATLLLPQVLRGYFNRSLNKSVDECHAMATNGYSEWRMEYRFEDFPPRLLCRDEGGPWIVAIDWTIGMLTSAALTAACLLATVLLIRHVVHGRNAPFGA
ncbi:hypothetical protein [Ruania halotolerans]|uniref:hypothetical protein n=1 Tax=Ruania halotolerans TaxID=2897773 RepID=UPI001E5F1560|nr:hypothetical protein [Ruania halotolerans]UFU05642.1 hypothetical protein LQF10_14505 [Ruania halotolerans]